MMTSRPKIEGWREKNPNRIENFGVDTAVSEAAPEYAYSVKIERTAKGARYTVHAYNQEKQAAMDEAVGMYVALGKALEAQGEKVAPIEEKA